VTNLDGLELQPKHADKFAGQTRNGHQLPHPGSMLSQGVDFGNLILNFKSEVQALIE
jgi:hypothetical protein